jgi:dipeptidyl aminopeptidase/acylaminoacyl peptidase
MPRKKVLKPSENLRDMSPTSYDIQGMSDVGCALYEAHRRGASVETIGPRLDLPVDAVDPVWSPDGSRVVFDSHRQGPDPQSASDAGLYERPASGATAEQPMLDREKGVQHSPRDWSADGKTLVFAKQGQNGRWNLWALPLTGDRKPFPYRKSEFNENEAALSPNGQFVAFTSNESGRNEVIVQPFPDASRGRWQISSEGGSAPRCVAMAASCSTSI